ncbi:MAG: FAD-dependent oxidoreductase [Oscillospiraceae bacterium]|jgi:NAD(P)H-nitrite reductase large subunit|nr:FAD-dependent oxidoreductase [Oscillospiraceae bacterium]
MRHVIIGAGAAGVAAARTLRKLKPEDEIVIVSADGDVHSRCMLHKYIGGTRTKSELSFVDAGFFRTQNVKWLKNTTVTGIDVPGKNLRTSGENLSFDKLLVATGAQSVIPPIGALRSADNVYSLRHLTDAEAIRTKAQTAERIVIIGAGLVGLDAAYALIELGKKALIVEMGERVLLLNLDDRSAREYQRLFEEHGCEFRLGRRVMDTVTGVSGASVTGIVLDGNDTVPCDMVIVAAGVRPATGLFEGSGISCDRAVTVDEHLRTSAPDIYAAGDVTGLSGIWPNAVEMGEVAAKNMAGRPAVYEDRYAIKNVVNFFGLTTLSVGELEPENGETALISESGKDYKKLILRDGAAAGVIFQGDIAYSGFWQHLIKNRIKIDEPVWQTSYADYFSVSASGEYQYELDQASRP